jgi:tetratricopeptide (TPR) repeat protein
MTQFPIQLLSKLPRRKDDIWQCDYFAVPLPQELLGMGMGKLSLTPWTGLCLSLKTGRIRATMPSMGAHFETSQLLDCLAEFALGQDEMSVGHLPGKIQVSKQELATLLFTPFKALGIEIELVPELAELNDAFEDLNGALESQADMPGILDGKGVTAPIIQGYAQAAFDLHKAAPWQYLGDMDLIQVESPSAPKGLAFLTIMGMGRQTWGISFYDSQADYQKMMAQDPASNVMEKPRWGLLYCNQNEVPLKDVRLWEERKLPVAGPEAYPVFTQFAPDTDPVSPDASQLLYIQALMRALAVSSEAQIDTGRWTVGAKTSAGSMLFTFALPDLLTPPTPAELKRRNHYSETASEHMNVQMARILKEKDFSTTQEAQAFLESTLSRDGAIDPAKLDPGLSAPRTPLEKAQDMCYIAREETIGRRTLHMARKALEMSPDCADAYLLLATYTSDRDKAIALLEKGVLAGRKALGEKSFENPEAAHFWVDPVTRPYMRTLHELSVLLADAGRFAESASALETLLTINPQDNQGARFDYIPTLIFLEQYDKAWDYLDDCPFDGTAFIDWAAALLGYVSEGETPDTKHLTVQAIKKHPLVAQMIRDYAGEPFPEFVDEGDESDESQAAYAYEALSSTIANAEGFADWVDDCTPPPEPRKGQFKKRKN